ncbi:MAG: SDR family NAD(P)-dependent oxidoreductase [Hydrogenophilales bacterium]
MKNIIVFGGTSSIAKSIINSFHGLSHIVLVGRDLDKLKTTNLKDLDSNTKKSYKTMNFDDIKSYKNQLDEISNEFSDIDLVLIAHGILPSDNHKSIHQTLNINSISNIAIIDYYFKYFKRNNGGTIASITSVAGDLARRKNFLYGASKSIVSFYIEGLRYNCPKNIILTDIRPGPINTPMTINEKKSFLFFDPERISKRIVTKILKKKKVIYAPFFWRYIMFILKRLPKSIIGKINA